MGNNLNVLSYMSISTRRGSWSTKTGTTCFSANMQVTLKADYIIVRGAALVNNISHS